MTLREADLQIEKIEDREWIASLQWIIENESDERARELLALLHKTAEAYGISAYPRMITDYINTIPPSAELQYPGNLELEEKICNVIRWNAMAMVVRANRENKGIGGHISTYSSASMLFEVGFNHFFRGYDRGLPDLVYFQGHATPGVYARSYVEHRLGEHDLSSFRLEIKEQGGLPSYPHPRSMHRYWRFPTVSMGLSPLQAIYQARFFKYLENRGLKEKTGQVVWTFLGDGEMDEPESTGALSVAAREKLDNLIFVVNCNLQRLDGPVRGNGKIVNELEGIFKGAGWNVIKVLWGSAWDPLFEKDREGILTDRLNKLLDGQLQRWAQLDGKALRREFFDRDEKLRRLAGNFSDEALDRLGRGGHDPVKVYNAYRRAVDYEDGPTVILAQTVKGYGQGAAGEASNITHKQKAFNLEQLKKFRDRLAIPIGDDELDKIPFFRFEKDSDEYRYLSDRRRELQGWLPDRKNLAGAFSMPEPDIFREFYEGAGDREVATTGAFVRLLSKMLRDKNTGRYVVPIIPDESRTFGMDALFREFGIYAPAGQQYEPVDKDSLIFYNESREGVIIEEGITEAGSMATFMAAGTHHLAGNFYTIPFFIFYSMFGFQRIGDLIWAAADSGAKGFLIGGISGRTTLSGEGLQHADGQSHLYAMAFPNLRAYDPAFAYEMAVIVQDGLNRMYKEKERIFYYITVMNQAYKMPPMPKNVEKGILKGIYPLLKTKKKGNRDRTVNLLGSGAIITEVQKAAQMLETEFDVPVNIWSVTSYKALYDDARDTERLNIENGEDKKSFVYQSLQGQGNVFVAVTDYVKAIPLTISKWVPGDYIVLGTDGFGRSDTVPALRDYFEVDARHIVGSALSSLHTSGKLPRETFDAFREKYEVKHKVNPAAF